MPRSGHDLEECRTYLDRKKKGDKLAAPIPHWGDHRQANSDNDEQLNEINMIFGVALDCFQDLMKEARARD
jgi:hypothetical protein